MFRRNRLAMLVAEFLGAGVLTLAVLSVQRSQLGLAYFVALAAGITIAVLTYVFSNISGAHFNPALTIALWSARRVRTLQALSYIVVQLLGAWAAYALYHYFVRTEVQPVTQAFNGRILAAEAIGTMIFALAWAAASYERYETGRFAALAGLAFSIAIIIASAASVGLANPALALGVRAWEVFGENGWANYVAGPLLGSLIGVNLYGVLFANADRPFGGFRRRDVDAPSVVTVTETVAADDDESNDEDVSDDTDVDTEDTSSDEPEEKPTKANKTASRGIATKEVPATSKGATKVARSKKTSTKRVPRKR